MEEMWAEIEGFPGYIVSNYGYVVSLKTDRQLTARPNSEGYLRVALYVNGYRHDVYVHQLVAMGFFGNFRPGMHVKHVNGDKADCSTRNLRLRRSVEPRHRRYGQREPWGKRVKIIETGEIFRTVRDCANYLGGDYADIYRVLRGERRTHMGYSFEYYEGN